MPRGDKTGPTGKGPMTGRGLGYCSGSNMPGFKNVGNAANTSQYGTLYSNRYGAKRGAGRGRSKGGAGRNVNTGGCSSGGPGYGQGGGRGRGTGRLG